MIRLGLSTAQKKKLNDLLVSHHRIAVSIQLMDLSHNYLADLSPRLLSGQVDVDASADESTRSCSVEILDPFNQLHLDGDAPDDGSIYFTRMFKIIYSVISIDRQTRFDIPIFCGPLTKVERNGAVLSCTAAGKEKLSMSAVWKGRSFKKGARKTWVISTIMSEIAGEKKLNIPNATAKIPKKLSLDKDVTPWQVAKNIAATMGCILFYDGRGILNLRKKNSRVIYTFNQKRELLTSPTASFDAESVINSVQVIGGKPKKAKKKITYRVVAPRSHALSPWNMGRWGTPRFLPEVVEDDSIRSKAEARKVARARLRSALFESVEVAFDSLPIPYLEEGDTCRVVSNQYTGKFRLTKFSIPLTADGVMSVGYLKRTSPSKRWIRIKNAGRKKGRRNR